MSTIKKIIFSNFDDRKNPYYGGGGAIAIHEVAKRLVSNFNITVITGKYPESKDEIIDGISYKRIGIASMPPQIAQLIFQFLLPIYVLKENFDIWVESFTPPFSTAFLPLFTKEPVIGLAHLLGGNQMYEKYGIPFHWLEAFGLKFYKTIICVAPYQREELLGINKNLEVFVIPNGINSEDLPVTFPILPRKHILFLGRIDIYQKGLDLLVEAVSNIKVTLKYKIIIAGSGTQEDEQRFKELITKQGLENSFELVGRVEGTRKQELLQTALVLVLPSRLENFAISALDAFAQGTPVLAFDIPGLSWFDEDVAVKVKPFDAEIFGEELLFLTENEEVRKKLGSNAFKLAKGYTWEKVTPEYRQVIEESL